MPNVNEKMPCHNELTCTCNAIEANTQLQYRLTAKRRIENDRLLIDKTVTWEYKRINTGKLLKVRVRVSESECESESEGEGECEGEGESERRQMDI